ncbi:High-affinity nickel-transport domain containing protein [Lactarius tabidus]
MDRTHTACLRALCFLRCRRRLTLFGRSMVLVGCELLANAICWIVAGILFGGRRETQSILSLSLLAWTIGLRHALDADHISAIDNATRGLISLGQLPVTCGLFFSLGHSTIVIVVNVAIAISTDVANKIGGVGHVGGVVGSSVSAAFLFIVGLANSVILHRVLRKRRQNKKRREQQLARGEQPDESEDVLEDDGQYNNTIMMKILGPVVRFVDRPWKVLLVPTFKPLVTTNLCKGFDTASSIALLAVSVIAKRGVPPADVVILPFLFTAGMTLLDSIDSILMLYSYTGFPERGFRIFEPVDANPEQSCVPEQNKKRRVEVVVRDVDEDIRDRRRNDMTVKRNMMSGLSIVLTLMSIIVAFRQALAWGSANAFRAFVPPHHHRVPRTWHTAPFTLLPFIPYSFMSYLVRRPDTHFIRLLVLPTLITTSLYSSYGYAWLDPSYNVFNWAVAVFCVILVGKGIDMALARTGRHKQGEDIAGTMSISAIATKEGSDAPGDASTRERQCSTLLPLWLQDALELMFSMRGLGWDFGKGVYTPPATRPQERLPFLRATLNSFFVNYLILDIVEATIKLIPGVGDPFGGSIFFAHLPFPTRYIVSTIIHVLTGIAFVAGFGMVYDLITLFAVAVLSHSPSSWPPVMDNPWAAQSLHDFERLYQRHSYTDQDKHTLYQ